MNYLEWMISVLEQYSIELPDKEIVATMTKDQENGWGDYCNCRHLSIILNHE